MALASVFLALGADKANIRSMTTAIGSDEACVPGLAASRDTG